MIFYTHVEHGHTKPIYVKYYYLKKQNKNKTKTDQHLWGSCRRNKTSAADIFEVIVGTSPLQVAESTSLHRW